MTERKNLHKYASISKRFVVPSIFSNTSQIARYGIFSPFSHSASFIGWNDPTTLSEEYVVVSVVELFFLLLLLLLLEEDDEELLVVVVVLITFFATFCFLTSILEFY